MLPGNLPAFLTTLIGREKEVSTLQQLLRHPDTRLLTIAGPGGVGKTSLALKIAQNVQQEFEHGVYFVSLAPITDPTLIIPTITQTLGVEESPEQLPLESLKDFLHNRQILLLLDNFEQLIQAAPLLTELLTTAKHLKLLVTSRETLRLRGENEFPLLPLELVDSVNLSPTPSLQKIMGYAGIALFVQRARNRQADFRLTEENAALVAEICARLDGLPLAIELAAARINLLPPKTMLARLKESSLKILTSGVRDAPDRQKTLRDTIRWSYDLLNSSEQRAFRRLSVLVGGCTLEAAETLLGEGGWELGDAHSQAPVSVLDLFTFLIDKNLVRRTGTDNDPRLDMLETIREFGREKLEQTGELEALQTLHAQYYLSLAETAEHHLMSREQKIWLKRLELEQDNFRAALHWGFHMPEQRMEFILRLTCALTAFWFPRGQWGECRRWLEAAISASAHREDHKAWRAKVRYVGVSMFIYQGDLVRARILSEQSVSLYRELDDKDGLLAALLQLCRTLDYQEEIDLLQMHIEEALSLAESLPDSHLKAQAYTELMGKLVYRESSSILEPASARLEEAIRIYRTLENSVGLATALFLCGEIVKRQGDELRAHTLQEEAVQLLDVVDDHRLRMIIYSFQILSNWRRGNYLAARQAYDQLLRHQPSSALAKTHLEILAAILYGQGLLFWATRIFGLADQAIRMGPGKRVGDSTKEQIDTIRKTVRASLGKTAFERAYKEGQSLTPDDLLAIPSPTRSGSKSPPTGAISVEPLTSRELEVLRLLTQEYNNLQIAERLVVSRRTVDAHLRSIYDKLGVHSRESAIRLAMETGLLEK